MAAGMGTEHGRGWGTGGRPHPVTRVKDAGGLVRVVAGSEGWGGEKNILDM